MTFLVLQVKVIELIKSPPSCVLAFQLLYQVIRLREYQGVDPHFDTIARQYHDIVKVTEFACFDSTLPIFSVLISSFPLQKLEDMQWTIHQVEMDLNHLPDHTRT